MAVTFQTLEEWIPFFASMPYHLTRALAEIAQVISVTSASLV